MQYEMHWATVVRDNPNALIIDFFAGSGTTLHAVELLNEYDGGHRRCILVTNNEVSEDEARTWPRRAIARATTPGNATASAAQSPGRVPNTPSWANGTTARCWQATT